MQVKRRGSNDWEGSTGAGRDYTHLFSLLLCRGQQLLEFHDGLGWWAGDGAT